MRKIQLLLSTLLISFSTINLNAQSIKTPAKSPLANIKQAVGLGEVSFEYSRPSKSGRVVFGDVVPFNEIWRVGANASTKVTFGEDVKLNGEAVKAGTYSFYLIPTQEEWTIIINSNTNLWGTGGYSEKEDVLRFKVKTQKVAELVETFTIQFSGVKQTELVTDLVWENTKISFTIAVDVDEKIMKNIESTMASDKRPYHQSAQYYYDNKKDLKQALEWATKAFETNPKAYWSGLLKAKIQLELNDKKGAKETAILAKKVAEEDKDENYAKQAEEIIKEASKK
jgi:tetratricopeptide (TPR) repeat protein